MSQSWKLFFGILTGMCAVVQMTWLAIHLASNESKSLSSPQLAYETGIVIGGLVCIPFWIGLCVYCLRDAFPTIRIRQSSEPNGRPWNSGGHHPWEHGRGRKRDEDEV